MASPQLVYVCEICQTILQEHHCKAICPNCGRTFDCSDLPLMAANASVDGNTSNLKIRAGSDPRDWLPLAAADIVEEMERTERKEKEEGADLP